MRYAEEYMPYILNTNQDIKEMLNAIGVSCAEELYSQLPIQIKLTKALDLPEGLSEEKTKRIIEALAQRNKPLKQFNSFLGAGCYQHYIPAALEPLISRTEFLTAYTPYQAESSQGILQAIYEYQTYICLLSGMDVSNASLFDGASSLAESALMALRLTQRKKILVSSATYPQYLQTLKTYLSGRDFKIEEINFDKNGLLDIGLLRKSLDNDTACFAFQSPNFFGNIENIPEISSVTKEKGAISVLVTSPMVLALLKEPAKQGVDIVCGDGQELGGPLNFGGPSFGFLATKNDFLRQLPGRIVGKTIDKNGNSAYCLTLQAREQHIRREKATSNICSNQSLNAIMAAIYLSLMGKEGLEEVALYSLNAAHYLYQRLKETGKIKFPFSSVFFNEFVWKIDCADKIINKLYKKNIIAGLDLGKFYPQLKDCILSYCSEIKTKEEIDNFVELLKEVL
jgi:glycine dehydrogenase subunit 1